MAPAADGAFKPEQLLRLPQSWLRTPFLGPRHRHLPICTAAGSATAVLMSDGWQTPQLIGRAAAAIAALVENRIGGEWFAIDPGPDAVKPRARYASLVVLPDPRRPEYAFTESMLSAAKQRPASEVLVVAPWARSARAISAVERSAGECGWRAVAAPTNPWALLDAAVRIFTWGDEIGFLGLLKDLEVNCFGPAFYAGWGATGDNVGVIPHAARRTVVEIFAATYLLASRYCDPFTRQESSLEATCALLAEWRRINNSNRGVAACVGMSFWKRRSITHLLRSSDATPVFCRDAAKAVATARERRGTTAVWASREPAQLAELARNADVQVLRVEDGFLRSVGLGANFVPAASMVVDRRGMYYDATRPNDLEHLLNETQFDDAIRARADRLIQALIASGITKYNTGGTSLGFSLPQAQRIFVPGQVEDDRSILLGGAAVKRNLDLLAAVRSANPNAFIIYKPHPDVEAGHRKGAISQRNVLRFADRMPADVSSPSIISAVDEVHTITSLCGFEALLRGRRVVVYGMPFYAGWGLTSDLVDLPRRRRPLTLSELVAGSLILYPRYVDPVSGLPCGPELIVDRLSHPDLWQPSALVRLRRLQGLISRQLRSWQASPATGGGGRA